MRCASCGYLYYPDAVGDYLCDVCQASLEGYVASMAGQENPTLGWWQRQGRLRDGREKHRGGERRQLNPADLEG